MTSTGAALDEDATHSGGTGPVFLVGADRTGIGLLGELLERHPRLALTRRTDFWSRIHGRYGDLRRPANLERCLRDLGRDRRLRLLAPDPDRLLADLADGDVDYTRLFALLQQQRAERLGRPRWGDKSLDAERHADLILGAYPTARMIHVVRDPRDRYASHTHHRRGGHGDLGAGTAVWLRSVRLAERNLRRHAGRYLVVHYEALVREPTRVLGEVCGFIGEDVAPLRSAATHGAGEPVDALRADGLHDRSVGTHRALLEPDEIAFIQLVTAPWMRRHGYRPDPVRMSRGARLRFLVLRLPLGLLRLAAWWPRDGLRRARRPEPR